MKNTRIMAVLLIMVVAVLFIGGASAQNPVDVNKTEDAAPAIGAGTYQLMNGTVPLAEGIVFTGADTTTKLTTKRMVSLPFLQVPRLSSIVTRRISTTLV